MRVGRGRGGGVLRRGGGLRAGLGQSGCAGQQKSKPRRAGAGPGPASPKLSRKLHGSREVAGFGFNVTGFSSGIVAMVSDPAGMHDRILRR